MKRILLSLFFFFLLSNTTNAQCPTFSLNAPNGYTLNCTFSSLAISVTNSAMATYWWSGPGIISGATTKTAVIGSPGIYSVSATSGTCSVTQTFVIWADYSAPTGVISTSGTITCINPSANLIATSTGPGSVTVTWYNSSMVQQGPTSPSPSTLVVSIPGNYSAVLTNISNNCSSTFFVSAPVNTVAPTLTITGTQTVCLGTSTNLYASASGPVTYSWSSNAFTNSVNVLPNTTTTYTVTGTNTSNGCYSSVPVTVTVNPNCSDVWPGDANSDGVCNTLDVFELGLNFGQSGPPRSVTSNSWTSYYAANWTGTVSTGKNRAHSDCNGDGSVSAMDLTAISSNFSLTHSFKENAVSSGTIDIDIIPDQSILPQGVWGSASIYLGSPTNTISNLYGVRFEVLYNNTLIQTDSVYTVYLSSFLNAGNTTLDFDKRIFSNGKNYEASVRTNQTDVNGNGKIATMYYKIDAGVPNNTILNLGISNGQKISSTGGLTSLSTGSGTVLIDAIAAGINVAENSSADFSIQPNPSEGKFFIKTGTDKNYDVTVYNNLGQIITDLKTNGSSEIDLSAFGKGIYYIVLRSENTTRATKVILE